MALTTHVFTGHEDQLHFVRRGLSTVNKTYLATTSGGAAIFDTMHAADTNLATYVATDLTVAENTARVHEDHKHVFIRDAKIVAPACNAAGILTDADVLNNFDIQSDAQKNYTAQDGSLPATYQPEIGD